MSGVRKLQGGELIELRPGQARVTPDAGVTVHASETSDLANVIAFQRPRVAESHAPDVVLPTDAARLPAPRLVGERARLVLFAALSLAVHGALFMVFWRDPEPLASIGIEVISAEIVLGATTPAGVEKTQGELQANTAQGATDPQQTDPQREAEQKATEQPQNVQVAREETAPEQTTRLERQADERLPDDNAAAPREQRQPAEPKPAIAMVESATPDMATAAPRELPPDAMDVSLLPQPEEKPVEQKPKPTHKQAAPPKPVKNAAPERRRIDAPTRDTVKREAKASDYSTAASGAGIGRSSHDTNYRGLVSAHLARYKQYPADARSRGDGGTATVAFSLSGSGGVTSVRLTRGSGVASIDQEVQAMVRRASPFPAPPDGRPTSFAIPVSFRLQ
jgi:protein TonB